VHREVIVLIRFGSIHCSLSLSRALALSVSRCGSMAVARGVRIPDCAERVRHRISTAMTRELGGRPEAIDIIVEDIHV